MPGGRPKFTNRSSRTFQHVFISSNCMRAELPQIRNFIDGRFMEPIGGKYLDNIEPATGKPYSQVADSDAHDVELAVAAAEKAFRDWSKKTAAERSNFLLR